MDRISEIYEHKVQYYETDQMGIVHHSNYIRWFEEARCDLLNKLRCDYAEMEKKGIIIPVLSVTAEFKSMVRFGEVVQILPKFKSFNGVKFSISYEILDAATGDLRTFGESKHCFLGKDYKPIILKKTFPDLYDLFISCMQK